MACSVAAAAVREEGVGRRARTDQVGGFRNFISVFCDGRIVSRGVLWLMLWGREGGGWGWLVVVVGWWGHFVSLGCRLFDPGFVLPMSLRLYDAEFHSLLVALIGKAITMISSDWRDRCARTKLAQPINELVLPVVEHKPPFIF